jgi:hypothetical protein
MSAKVKEDPLGDFRSHESMASSILSVFMLFNYCSKLMVGAP